MFVGVLARGVCTMICAFICSIGMLCIVLVPVVGSIVKCAALVVFCSRRVCTVCACVVLEMCVGVLGKWCVHDDGCVSM